MRRLPEQTSQTPAATRKTLWRLLLGLCATLPLALVAGWLGPDEPRKEDSAVAAVAPAAPVALAAAGPASGSASNSALAGAPPKQPVPQNSQAAEFDVEALRQLDRQWCSHGAQAYLQFISALQKQYGDAPETKAQAEAQLKQWPTHRAMEQLQQRLPEQWIARLLKRGDARSRATALFLSGGDSGDAAAAVTQLSALARDSADPYVAALANQRAPACRSLAGCQPLSPAERLSKDSNNLVAFLDAYGDAPDMLQRLGRTLAQPYEVRSYNTAMLQTLLSLSLAADEGLSREVEQLMLMGIYSAWHIPNYSVVMLACRQLAADAAMERATCQVLAETLWTSGESTLERALAVRLAKAMRLQEQNAEWLAREQHLETVRHHAHAWFDSALNSESAIDSCKFQRDLAGHLRTLASLGEWQAYAALPRPEVPPARP